MTFDEILDQAIEMLQRRGRLTHRTLKRQFNLDDEALDDLKEELIKGQRLAVDENGEVLVWTGAPEPKPEPSSTTPAQQEVTQQVQPTQAEPPLSEPATPNAERRQLTVMFCDLADSTRLSGQLDPEDLRDVIRAYQTTSAEVIERFDGYIAQHLGDGLLVYFGYPKAHEDDAQRAVRAGLGLLDAMGPLNTRLESDHSTRLAVRIGIHTGPVVVGEIGGGGGRHEQLALGETPNVASRIQGIAQPDTVAISEATYRLIQGYFTCDNLGIHALRGVIAPMPIYDIRGESVIESRFEAATITGLTPLVGRDEEFGLLVRRWEQAKDGEGQVVLLGGEAGIGKSRLTQTLIEHLAEEPHIRLRYQGSPYHTNSAFYPLITQLERAAQFARDDTPVQKLDKLETLLAQGTDQAADVVPLVAALLAIPTGDRYSPLHFSPQRQKTKTMEVLVDQLVGLAHQHPVLCVFEDAHWSDPTSLEVLDLLVHRVPDGQALLVITYRPEFTPPWGGSAHVTTHVLNRLTRRQVTALMAGVTGGKALPDVVLDQIVAKTDGVPLFVEELTKTVLESGLLVDQGDHYALAGPLPPLAIPATLHDSLMARLDRLTPVKEVAQIGAAIGREFTYELVAAVSPLQETALQDALDQLISAELLFRRGTPPAATYLFKHALVQDAAYASLLRSRRQQLHTTIATVLAERFPLLAATEPEVVAYHYTEAGLSGHAIPYWQQAGQRAVERSANVEAIEHLTTGLQLLKILTDAQECTHQELTLLTTLGPALMATKGYASPEAEQTYARARELGQQMEHTPQLFAVFYGLWAFYLVRAEFPIAQELAEQLLTLAQRVQDSALLVVAHQAMGTMTVSLGDEAFACTHLERALAFHDPQQHRALAFIYGQDPAVFCLAFTAWAQWLLGYPTRALAKNHEAISRANELAHSFSLASVLAWAAIFHALRRDVQATYEQAETAITLSTELGFPFRVAEGTILRGWALAALGKAEEGIAQIHQGLAVHRATGAEIARPWWLALLAEAYGKAGQPEEGLITLAEALELVHKTGENQWEAELHRLQGELLLARSTVHHTEAEAERCFHRALDVARRQQAKSWELRAATSLARLWQSQGKRLEAYDLLAPVYDWFTEGFDTADLQEAKRVLGDLS